MVTRAVPRATEFGLQPHSCTVRPSAPVPSRWPTYLSYFFHNFESPGRRKWRAGRISCKGWLERGVRG